MGASAKLRCVWGGSSMGGCKRDTMHTHTHTVKHKHTHIHTHIHTHNTRTHTHAQVRAREFYGALYPEATKTTGKAKQDARGAKGAKKGGQDASAIDDTPQPIRPIRCVCVGVGVGGALCVCMRLGVDNGE